MVTWASRLSPSRLDWAGDPRLLELERRYFSPVAAPHAVLDLSPLAEAPTALAVVRGDGERTPRVAVGAGSATTIGRAWWKALGEAYSVRTWGRGLLLADPSRRFDSAHADIVDFADHIHLYAAAARRDPAAFLDASAQRTDTAGVPPVAGTTEEEQVAALADGLARQGIESYVVDVTSPDIADAGLTVSKVVAPELCPLDARHDCRFLGGPRLRRRAFDLGLRQTALTEAELNPDPHPFP
jgi:ribosomal protein S12 methylthiotransferase accessory factor